MSPKRAVPLATGSRPMRLFMSVVFPAPLRPIHPVMLPAGRSSETSRRSCTLRIATLSLLTLSTRLPDHVALHLGVAQRALRRRVRDDAAVVEGDDALGEAAHHFHVVLDEDHGGAL